MNEGKFWLSFWAIVGVVILGITYLSTNYWMDYNTKFVQAIKDGVNPMELMCATQDSMGDNPTCVILAAKK